jgi:hypothetical protein
MNMKARCFNTKHHSFARYGGAGLTVCQRWLTFENFLADMGVRPVRTTLDRIDNAKGYEPGNCRWATTKVQGSNRACVEQITFNGKTQNCEDWARELGILPQTLRTRIARGWTLDRAIKGTREYSGRGEANPHAVLNEKLVLEIRAAYTGKRGDQARLARKYGVRPSVIGGVVNGRTWRPRMTDSARESRSEPLMPFWQWKAQQYAKDQAEGNPHTKEWYYRAYGGYCNKVRQKQKESESNG